MKIINKLAVRLGITKLPPSLTSRQILEDKIEEDMRYTERKRRKRIDSSRKEKTIEANRALNDAENLDNQRIICRHKGICRPGGKMDYNV